MKITKVIMAIAIVTTLGFVSCKPKDADLQTAIETKLKTKPDMTGLTVAVKDGVATIAGECSDSECKADCEKMTSEVKGVKSVINNLNVTAPPPPPPAPTEVMIAPDTMLTGAVADAVKDFGTVKATVAEGVVTLTGSIKKMDLPKLMMSLNSLKPKKIENKLTIK